MSVLTDISDAVADELNSQTWLLDFQAKRMNVPRIKREEASNLHVTVSPKSRSLKAFNRSRVLETIEVYIGIQQGLAGDQNSQSDPLISLGEMIDEYFLYGRKLASYSGATCTMSTFGSGQDSPFMSTKDEDGLLMYTGVVTLAFQLMRTASA